MIDVACWQCAPKARITSGGRIPPRELSIDLVADERFGWVTGGWSLVTKAALGG